MLTNFHKGLIALLGVQLVLVVVVMLRGGDHGAAKEHALLPGFDAAKVTKIEVSTTGKPAVTLTKGATGWVVSSAFDYPVDEAKVTDLLAPLAKMKAAAPIATQQSRLKQLRVADDDFERRVVITADGKEATLYVGGQAGTRRTAVRFGGDDDVYAVTGVTPSIAGDDVRDWMQTGYVSAAKEDVASIKIQHGATTVVLTRDAAESPWRVTVDGAELPAIELDTAAVDRLADDATDVTATAPGDPKTAASAPAATVTIEQRAAKDAKSSSLAPAPIVFDVVAAGDAQWWVKDRAQTKAAMVDKAKLDPLVTAAKDKLVKPAPAGSGAGSGSAGSNAPLLPPLPPRPQSPVVTPPTPPAHP
jgi:hypothetical protein|nr:DUF4340 domain-containing protein [Kofleriaceae bacterium]